MGKGYSTVSQEDGHFETVAARVYSGGEWKDFLVVKRSSRHERRVSYACPHCIIDRRRRPVLRKISESAVDVQDAIVSLGFGDDVVSHRPELRKREQASHVCPRCKRFYQVIGTPLGPVEDITQEVLGAVHY
jgi:hypothetical protein